MSNEIMHALIAKMYVKMNLIIQKNDFDLLADEVQVYSRRLDKVLIHYSRNTEQKKIHRSDQRLTKAV
ncbi:MAG: TetR family transcriptional regulator [Bacillota bacterium]|nr:TetR family transcriptional regulator [Bacillota bacterium]